MNETKQKSCGYVFISYSDHSRNKIDENLSWCIVLARKSCIRNRWAPELHWWCIDHALIVHLFPFTVPSSSLTARARLGNLDLDFKLWILDLQSNAQSKNKFQRWSDICSWIPFWGGVCMGLYKKRRGNPFSDFVVSDRLQVRNPDFKMFSACEK